MSERTADYSNGPIEDKILTLRGQKVILDSDLAHIYGVPTKRLNEQVRRNKKRFPADFAFQLTSQEVSGLKSQFATSSSGGLNRSQIATGSQKHRDPRFPPFAFTEHGAIQAANVLNSPKAIEMGIYVVRAFLRLREVLASNRELARQLTQLEARLDKKLADHDKAIAAILSAIRQLMSPPPARRRPIGFTADLGDKK